jgi:hypothetical protein
MWRWLVRDWQWPAAALFTAVFLFALAPVFAGLAGAALALVYVQLPIYLIHQWEEHTGDRFRLHVNRTVGGGREVLTPAATFWINCLGVWVYNLVFLDLAWAIEPSAGLAAAYLAVVNGVVHLVPAVVQRAYNPGLITAVLLLLPVGGWCAARVGSGAGLGAHAIGLASAVGVHVGIIVHVVSRLARLPKAVEPPAAADPARIQAF